MEWLKSAAEAADLSGIQSSYAHGCKESDRHSGDRTSCHILVAGTLRCQLE